MVDNLIFRFFWSFLKGLQQTLLDQVWNHFEIFLAVTNEGDILRENVPYNYCKDLIDINWSEKYKASINIVNFQKQNQGWNIYKYVPNFFLEKLDHTLYT